MAYQQITRLQLRTQLVERLGANGPTFWRTTELNFYINEALRMFGLLTGFWKTRTTLATTAATTWYALPNAITSSFRLSWQGFPLGSVSLNDLDYGRPNWESETTATGGDVPTRPQSYAIGGINLIALWPADAAGGTVMTLDGLAATPTLTADGQFLDLGLDELKIILDYCQHLAQFKEGGKEFQAAQDDFKTFLKACAERSSILRQSAIYRRYMGFDKHRWQKKMIPSEDEVQAGAR